MSNSGDCRRLLLPGRTIVGDDRSASAVLRSVDVLAWWAMIEPEPEVSPREDRW